MINDTFEGHPVKIILGTEENDNEIDFCLIKVNDYGFTETEFRICIDASLKYVDLTKKEMFLNFENIRFDEKC
jgi:hypothetical protein